MSFNGESFGRVRGLSGLEGTDLSLADFETKPQANEAQAQAGERIVVKDAATGAEGREEDHAGHERPTPSR